MSEYSRPFRHDVLFSSYYLERFLPEDDAWRVPTAEVTQALSKLKTLYRHLADELPQMGERETEGQFIEKALEILGFSYIPQPPQVAGGQPDFALFASDAEKKKARKSRHELDYKLAIAISESKYWDRPLDRHRGEDEREVEKSRGQHPGVQITNYLYRTGLTWGILTNGIEWRLYHREASGNRLKNYYGINLVELLEKGSEEDFRYFYALFRKESFLPVGQSLLDRALEGSRLCARELGDDLKESIYKALRILAEGFFADPKTTLSPNENLELVRENSLIYLYRLLFILYAESPREGEYLLPLDNRTYRENYSLDILKKQIVEKGATSGSPVKHTYWEHLDTLFSLVNKGSREFGIREEEFVVPPYNGGLFAIRPDPKTGRDFFEVHRVPDLYLDQVIDLLARPERKGSNGREFVDYSSLEIRHLGSIYEGLLEYRLQVAKEEMAAVKEERREKWISAKEAGNRKVLDRVRAGGLYLVTDRGERKATGSYYTPDYIVKYIVENTLGPLIEEKKQKVLGKVQALESKAKSARGYNREAYERELRQTENQLVDEILSLKVLDPAMGSGHFLVEATDYLARALVEALGGRVALEGGRSAKRVADTQAPYRRSKVDEDEIRWARREVVEKCIYGVDLNPLAVELAKLSLWLSTVAKDRPLSFLDHHLRCGNSLIGARVKDLAQLPLQSKKTKTAKWEAAGQISTLEHIFMEKVHLLLGFFEQIEAMPSETVEQIKKKDEYYWNFREQIRRFQEVADIWTSLSFGNEITWEEYHVLQEKLRASEAEWEELKAKPWSQKGLAIARNKGFFHWELEFPEVFYEGAREKANPGFDAVIGNPPYVRQEGLGELKSYLVETYAAAHGMADIYVYFFDQGLKLLRTGGKLGLISSNKFMRSNYGVPLRKRLTDGVHIQQIIDFGELPVFPEAATFPAIFIIDNALTKQRQTLYAPIKTLVFSSLEEAIKERAVSLSSTAFTAAPWSLGGKAEDLILRKMETVGQPLGEYCGGQLYRGVTTGLNKAFVVDQETRDQLIRQDPKCASIIKPFLAGDDIRRYEIYFRDMYLIFARRDIEIDKFPSVKKHLEQFKKELTPKQKMTDPIGRKPGSYEWYEIQDTTAYFNEFEKPKIIYPDIAITCRFALDTDGRYYLGNTGYILPRDDKYLLALLNSQLIEFYYKLISPVLGDPNLRGRLRFIDTFVSKIPIRCIDFTTPAKERKRLLEKGKKLYEHCMAKGDQLCVTGFVEHCLAQKPEQADVVHDLLAFLAEQMIDMNKQKHAEVKGFLMWLEREIKTKIEDLTNKTKVKEYHEGSFEELLEILKANRKKLGIDPGRREFSERLKNEFDRSLAKLRPLKDRLVATDRLIDQIVYQLYGLTEEEIRIVEGSVHEK